jgi:predicted hydrocarbon binding protein
VHGLIFASLHDYVATRHGTLAARLVFAAEPDYLLTQAYPDERLDALLRRTAAEIGSEPDIVTYDFGVFAGSTTFARLYPAFFSEVPNACEFLLTVEGRIHELVRATVPNAEPPRLRVTRARDDAVEIEYSSPRRLCTLLRGLAEGVARRFGETTAIEETSCMKRGDDACRLTVTFRPLDV